MRPPILVAAAGLVALPLAGCSTSAPPPPPPTCPTALLLQGAERTASYLPGSERQPDALRHLAVMTNLASGCRYGDDGVDMDLAFDLIAERGPALTGDSAELQFFVATIAPSGEILSKQILSSEIDFANQEVAGVNEQLTVRLPEVTPEQGGSYNLFLGFQLDEAELQERLRPLLR